MNQVKKTIGERQGSAPIDDQKLKILQSSMRGVLARMLDDRLVNIYSVDVPARILLAKIHTPAPRSADKVHHGLDVIKRNPFWKQSPPHFAQKKLMLKL